MYNFDYAANTPVDPAVIEYYSKESTRYIANPNSSHSLGREAKARMEQITEHIAGMLQVDPSEIIYTSGASEANNLAVKGVAYAQRQRGKHIISTSLEHSSVSGALTYLQSQGYEIDLLDVTSEGIVDIEHLQELLREDTILVSICYVDSELGVQQPIAEIAKLLEGYPNCFFHTDATQAVGKIPVHFDNVDMMTFAPHKFYGLNGCGVLLKRKHVILEPLIHGGASSTIYRSGTPDLAHAASIEKALEIALKEMEARYKYIEGLKKELVQALQKYPKVRINSTGKSIPHIINLSVQGVKSPIFVKALDEAGICVSIKSACSVENTPSRPVYAVTKDRKNAMSSWRISLSHLTTQEELKHFLDIFDKCYHELTE